MIIQNLVPALTATPLLNHSDLLLAHEHERRHGAIWHLVKEKRERWIISLSGGVTRVEKGVQKIAG